MKSTQARTLRQNSTDAERKLWAIVRGRRLKGFKFRRQQPLGLYVVDLICFEKRLIVEVDGGQHAERAQADARRTHWLETEGFRILRFWNNEVLGNPEGVSEAILTALRESPSPGR